MVIARSSLLVAKCRLLEAHRKIAYHRSKPSSEVPDTLNKGVGSGSMILLEGQPGVGKSHLVSSSLVQVLPGRTVNYHVCASPLPAASNPRGQPVSQTTAPLGMVALQYLNKRHGNEVGDVKSEEGRTALLLAELREMDGEGSAFLPHAHLLNDMLGVRCEAPPVVEDLMVDPLDEAEQKTKQCELIMLAIFRRLSEWKPSIIVVENAHYLEEGSWSLCAAIANGKQSTAPQSTPHSLPLSLPLVVVFVSRPPEFRGLYQPNSSSSAVVKQLCSVISLDGVPPEVMEGVLVTALGPGVRSLSSDLYVLIERCGLGNPRIAVEFLSRLRDSEMLSFKRVNVTSEGMRESVETVSLNRLSFSTPETGGSGNEDGSFFGGNGFMADLSIYFRQQLSKESGDGAKHLASSLTLKYNLIPLK